MGAMEGYTCRPTCSGPGRAGQAFEQLLLAKTVAMTCIHNACCTSPRLDPLTLSPNCWVQLGLDWERISSANPGTIQLFDFLSKQEETCRPANSDGANNDYEWELEIRIWQFCSSNIYYIYKLFSQSMLLKIWSYIGAISSLLSLILDRQLLESHSE